MELGYMEASDISLLFEKLTNILGQDVVLSEVIHYFNSDQIKGFCESLMNDYDIDDENE